MSGFFYKLLQFFAHILGPWFFSLIARFIAAGYFLFSPLRGESIRFYARAFPDRGRFFPTLATFKQYQNFTTIHFDRFLTSRRQEASFTSRGWEKLEEVMGKQGGILLMSHLGNWEMAATLLKGRSENLQLLLYMGVKEKEGVEKQQKEGLRNSGVTIIAADQEENSPFTAVEGIRFLRSGGLVSMAGDTVWRADQRRVKVRFLDGVAYIPEAPFVFSLVSGAPLFVFFAFRTGRNSYHFTLSDPIHVSAATRDDREEAILSAAQRYADTLQETLLQHPYEWYHFRRFLQ